MRTVIGLAGRAGAGKSTAAAHLVGRHGFVELAFADSIKNMVSALLGIPRHQLNELERTRSWRDEPHAALGGRTPRYVQQTLGTEWGRELIHPDLWVRAIEYRMERLPRDARVVISDVRFPNEALFVRYSGCLVHIRRDLPYTPAAGHQSERGITPLAAEPVVDNNGDLEQLRRQLDAIVERIAR